MLFKRACQRVDTPCKSHIDCCLRNCKGGICARAYRKRVLEPEEEVLEDFSRITKVGTKTIKTLEVKEDKIPAKDLANAVEEIEKENKWNSKAI